MKDLQNKFSGVSYKFLLLEQKIDRTLIVSQKIQNDQNYMPIFYVCGACLVLASVFFLHNTFCAEKIKNLHSTFLTNISESSTKILQTIVDWSAMTTKVDIDAI